MRFDAICLRNSQVLRSFLLFLLLGVLLADLPTSSLAQAPAPAPPAAVDDAKQGDEASPMGLADRKLYQDLSLRPLNQFTNQDLSQFLSLRQKSKAESGVPEYLGDDVQSMARMAAGTPYRLYTSRFDLGEADCVCFVERSIAMALAWDWDSYHQICERLRHKNGVVEFKNRNFYTLSDWVPNNAWALDDITGALGGGQAAKPFTYVVRPKRFSEGIVNEKWPRIEFLGADYSSPDKRVVTDVFIPRAQVEKVLQELEPGDVFLAIREYHKDGLKNWYDCDHMGLIGYGPTIMHSAPPVVREEAVMQFLRKYRFVAGFKILRLKPNAIDQLALELPKVTKPAPPPEDQDKSVASLRESRALAGH